MSARALTACYLSLWLTTLAGAALTLVGAPLGRVDAPRPTLEPTLGTVGELVAHNTLVALWPLALLALGWPALAGARLLGDALIAAQLLAHGLLVGTAVAQRPELWRYLPHLPLEWLAMAIPAAAWLHARTAHPARRDPASAQLPLVLRVAVAGLAALVGAAAIETYLAPIR
jgi:hypothetical protein